MKRKTTSSAAAATTLSIAAREWLRPSGEASDEERATPPRELARRLSGTVEVLLLWHPDTDGVELAVTERATGVELHIQLPPSVALDAFYHPYAYAAKRATVRAPREKKSTAVDG